MATIKDVGRPRSYTPGRKMPVQLLVVHHTAGSEGPSSAESGAAYDRTRADGTSTHAFADSDTVCVEVPDEDRANHARAHGNEIGLGLELCGTLQTRAQWLDAASLPTLANGAAWAALKVVKFGLPVRRLSVAEVRAAYYSPQAQRPKGFAGHVDVTRAFPEDRGDHTDPGDAFPWDVFLGLVSDEVTRLNGGSDMGEFVILSDGPVKGGTYFSVGAGLRWMGTTKSVQTLIAKGQARWPANGALRTMTVAEAYDEFGPVINPIPGPPGPSILVPHTHAEGITGPAVAAETK